MWPLVEIINKVVAPAYNSSLPPLIIGSIVSLLRAAHLMAIRRQQRSAFDSVSELNLRFVRATIRWIDRHWSNYRLTWSSSRWLRFYQQVSAANLTWAGPSKESFTQSLFAEDLFSAASYSRTSVVDRLHCHRAIALIWLVWVVLTPIARTTQTKIVCRFAHWPLISNEEVQFGRNLLLSLPPLVCLSSKSDLRLAIVRCTERLRASSPILSPQWERLEQLKHNLYDGRSLTRNHPKMITIVFLGFWWFIQLNTWRELVRLLTIEKVRSIILACVWRAILNNCSYKHSLVKILWFWWPS